MQEHPKEIEFLKNAKSLNDDFFIKNAILCWLHHYPNHKWTDIYKELLDRDSYIPEVKPKPRRAKRVTRKATTE